MLGDGPIKNKRRLVTSSEEDYRKNRERMVKHQLSNRNITDPNVLRAFLKVPRHLFVPPGFEEQAYEDHPIQIGHEQTISQPYIVAFMIEELELRKEDRVLEIGTGSGYQTALLAELVHEVYSVELVPNLYESARKRLNFLGYSNVNLSCGDGRKGWVDKSPFDKIIVAAASNDIPKNLIEQLKEGGMTIIPVGGEDQNVVVGCKTNGVLVTRSLISVRFVRLQIKE